MLKVPALYCVCILWHYLRGRQDSLQHREWSEHVASAAQRRMNTGTAACCALLSPEQPWLGHCCPTCRCQIVQPIRGLMVSQAQKAFTAFKLLLQCFVYSNLHPAVLRESFCVLTAFEIWTRLDEFQGRIHPYTGLWNKQSRRQAFPTPKAGPGFRCPIAHQSAHRRLGRCLASASASNAPGKRILQHGEHCLVSCLLGH